MIQQQQYVTLTFKYSSINPRRRDGAWNHVGFLLCVYDETSARILWISLDLGSSWLWWIGCLVSSVFKLSVSFLSPASFLSSQSVSAHHPSPSQSPYFPLFPALLNPISPFSNYSSSTLVPVLSFSHFPLSLLSSLASFPFFPPQISSPPGRLWPVSLIFNWTCMTYIAHCGVSIQDRLCMCVSAFMSTLRCLRMHVSPSPPLHTNVYVCVCRLP